MAYQAQRRLPYLGSLTSCHHVIMSYQAQRRLPYLGTLTAQRSAEQCTASKSSCSAARTVLHGHVVTGMSSRPANHVYMDMYMRVCICACACTWTCACAYVHMRMCICMCMCSSHVGQSHSSQSQATTEIARRSIKGNRRQSTSSRRNHLQSHAHHCIWHWFTSGPPMVEVKQSHAIIGNHMQS